MSPAFSTAATVASGASSNSILPEDSLPDFKTKADVIYQYLRERILDGRLLAGSKVTLRGLASELRTSAMPVREAVRRLNHEGLIEITPHTGMRITGMSLAEGLQIYAVRSPMEGLAAGLAARNNGPAVGRRLLIINTELADAVGRADFHAISDANQRFHHEILRAAENHHLTRVLEDLWTRSVRLQLGFRIDAGSTRLSVAEHAEIATAIGDSDATAAESAARRHIERAASNLYRFTPPDQPKPQTG